MKQSYIGQKAFFLGNGIHRTEKNNGISWGSLLKKIGLNYSINTDLENDLKPFPLAFEEMLYQKDGRNQFLNKLRNLKSEISDILENDANNLIDNEVHNGFMTSGVKEIITTNYDYNLELSLSSNFLKNKIDCSISNIESKHSLYRGYNIDGINVRHIHGELKHNRKIKIVDDNNYPEESIMIGFEHYSEYFSKIQSVIKGESGKHKEEEKTSILSRIRDNNNSKIWTDLFFTHQLIFAGFSLDFSENHLWWLLLKREELKRQKNRYDIAINNKIIFCIPKFPTKRDEYRVSNIKEFDALYRKKLTQQKNNAVTDVLSSFKIEIDLIDCANYKEFYLKVIKKYSER